MQILDLYKCITLVFERDRLIYRLVVSPLHLWCHIDRLVTSSPSFLTLWQLRESNFYTERWSVTTKNLLNKNWSLCVVLHYPTWTIDWLIYWEERTWIILKRKNRWDVQKKWRMRFSTISIFNIDNLYFLLKWRLKHHNVVEASSIWIYEKWFKIILILMNISFIYCYRYGSAIA